MYYFLFGEDSIFIKILIAAFILLSASQNNFSELEDLAKGIKNFREAGCATHSCFEIKSTINNSLSVSQGLLSVVD